MWLGGASRATGVAGRSWGNSAGRASGPPRPGVRGTNWLGQAQNSGIASLKLLADRLKVYLRGILSRCRHPLNTSIVEGITNTIKGIKRRAYGYRDHDYFFLNIRSAFPGNLR